LRDSLDEKDLVVYYYTASSDYITKKNILMKTDADVHHKADAFFKVVIPGRRDEYIRLDFTINPEKDETKADVLIKASNDIDYENNDIELKLLVDGVVFDTAEVLSYRSPLLTR